MDIVFDLTKDELNKINHGISLADTTFFDWDNAFFWLDTRKDYGERRICGLGMIGSRLHSVVFTIREQKTRIISLRKANARERKKYEQKS